MAILQTYQQDAGNLEDIIPLITIISPKDTPLTSAMASKKATAMSHEWMTDALATPGLNAQVEGADATYGTLTARLRVTNYVQNIRKTGQISDNQQAVLKAGVKDEYAYQLEKAVKELALDTERMNIQGTRSLGDATTAAQSGGLMYWLDTNQVVGVAADTTAVITAATTTLITLTAGDVAATGAVVGSTIYISGGVGKGQYRTITGIAAEACTVATLDVAPVVASTVTIFDVPGALTETLLNDGFEACFNAGGDPNTVFCPAAQKRVISGFATSMRRLTDGSDTLTNSVDIYESDFGRHAVKTNRWQPDGTVAIVETGQFSSAYLRPVKPEEMPRSGSSRKFMIESAVCMESRAENSSAIIMGLSG